MKTKEHATQMLDKLIALDKTVVGAYYEMGRLLSAIEHGQLWDELGYNSFTHLVEEELSFGPTTAQRYLHTYRHFRRLKYTKGEALKMIQQFSYSNVARVLPTLNDHVGTRAIAKAIKVDERRSLTLSFTKEQWKLVEQALVSYGAVIHESGRCEHSMDAFLALIQDVFGKAA